MFLSSELCESLFPSWSSDISARVKACSINPIDVKIRGGVYDDAPGMNRDISIFQLLTLFRLLQQGPQRLPHPWI
jgi:hypothetical protein